VVGIAVLYFATQGNFIWAIGGGIAGGAVGYLIGRGIDKPLKK
jgi:membrane protein YqaA with SNARE-associated domain